MTSYSVQGATYDNSTSRIDEGATRSETYVDITRGRGSNHLFLTRGIDPLLGEHLPKAPSPPLVDSDGARLQASGPERASLEVDPAAAKPCGPEREAKIAGRRASRLARYRVPPDLLTRLQPRGDEPHLARHWDEVVELLASYRERWNTLDGSGPWEWAVGRATDDQAASLEREEVIGEVVKLTVASTREQLRRRGWNDVPAWAARHLVELAANGVGAIEPDDLSNLYARIADHRERRGLDAEAGINSLYLCEALLGPAPEDPVARTQHRLLSADLTQASTGRQTSARRIG